MFILSLFLTMFVLISPISANADNNFYALYSKKKGAAVLDKKGRYKGKIPQRDVVDVINMPGGKAVVLDKKGRYTLWSIPKMRREGRVPNIYR